MKEWEKELCDKMLQCGEIISYIKIKTKEGISVKTYTIKYLGETYTINKYNGEWNFMSREIH